MNSAQEISKYITIIRPEFMTFCKDACRAATLNHLLFRIAYKCKDQPKEQIQAGEVLWYAKTELITSEMSDAWGVCKVRKEVNALLNMNLIGRKSNPTWGVDRTKHFFFGSEQCQVFIDLCKENGVCVVHLDLPVEVKHLIYLSVANDTSIKCTCSEEEKQGANDKSIACIRYINPMHSINLSPANDISIEAITKITTKRSTEDNYEEEDTLPRNSTPPPSGAAIALPTRALSDDSDFLKAREHLLWLRYKIEPTPDTHSWKVVSAGYGQSSVEIWTTDEIKQHSERLMMLPQYRPPDLPAQSSADEPYQPNFAANRQEKGHADGQKPDSDNYSHCDVFPGSRSERGDSDPASSGSPTANARDQSHVPAVGRTAPVETPELSTLTASSPQASAKVEPRRSRTPAAPKVDQAEVEAYLAIFDELYREATGDPEGSYGHTGVDRKAITNDLLKPKLINPKFVTPEKLRAVYRHLFKKPKDETTGFCWANNMSIKAVCRNYATEAMTLTTQAQQAKAQKAATKTKEPTAIEQMRAERQRYAPKEREAHV